MGAVCWPGWTGQTPYKLKDCVDIKDCIASFEARLRADRSLLGRLPELAGKRLICHSAVRAPCHGDVLSAAFERHVKNRSCGRADICVGVRFTPQEFVDVAARLEHPFDT